MGLFGNNTPNNDNKNNQTIGEHITYDIDKMMESKINNVSGFDQLDITLKQNASIYTRAECQLIIDKTLTMFATIGGKGFVKAFYRSFSSGTFFINKISVSPDDPNNLNGPITGSGNVSIFSFLPGNILELKLKPGDSWCVHHNSFLACTTNISIYTGISLSIAITGNGLFYTKLENNTDKTGTAWLISYGGIVKKNINDNNNLRIHSGLFLACSLNIYSQIQVGLPSSIFSTIAGGQGIILDVSEVKKIEQDNIMYLQSGNLDEFLSFIAAAVTDKQIDAEIKTDAAVGLLDFAFSGGRSTNKRRFTKKNAIKPHKNFTLKRETTVL